MKTIIGYVNYGVMAHEKQTLFTMEPCEDGVSEKIELYIPDEFELTENQTRSILVNTPDGTCYMLHEILSSKDDNPIFRWWDKNGKYNIVQLEGQGI